MATKSNEIKSYFGKCRCCLEYGYLKNMWTVHHGEGESEVYGEMIAQCFAFTLEQIKGVDHDQICATCISRLRDACRFKYLVIKSQKILMQEDLHEGDKLGFIKVEDVKTENNFDSDPADVTVDGTGDDSQDLLERDIEMQFTEINETITENDDHSYEDVEYLEEEVITEKPEDDSEVSKPAESDDSGPTKAKWPKKLPRSERNKRYLQYTEEDLRKSIEAVKSERMSRLEAANYYNVPRKTLTAKLKMDIENVPDANKKKIMSVDVKDTKCAINVEKMKGECMRASQETNASKDEKEESSALQEMNKHKDNIHTILLYSNATMVKGQWGGNYACCFCKEKFPTPADLKRHNLEKHEDAHTKAIHVKYVSDLIIKLDITALRCLICGGKIDSLDRLMNHLKEHDKTIHMDIKNHIIPFKFEGEVLQCVACTKKYPYFKTLSEHMNEHYGNYECATCGKGFINSRSMQTHSYRHQKNVGVFKCTYCAREFDTRHRRSAHVRKIHLHGSKTRKCHVCEERFSSNPQVHVHMVKAHGAKPMAFKCDACDKSYANPGSLSLHKRRYHLMLRPNKCTECEMAFYSKMELQSHMVTHTRTKEFQCEICDKRFGTKCCLNQHMRAHFGIKNYRCNWCDLKFAARSKMKLHMLRKHREVV